MSGSDTAWVTVTLKTRTCAEEDSFKLVVNLYMDATAAHRTSAYVTS